MSEFQEVIRQWKRMLDAHDNGEQIAFKASCVRDAFEDTAQVEEIVMQWAAEHPETVYPTWDEWLSEIGVLESPVPVPNMIAIAYYGGMKAHEPIPAEIAEKLGIEPKEG